MYPYPNLNLRLKRLHFACIQRRYAYGDAPPWCCGTFPVIANPHWSRSRANMNTGRNFYEALGTQVAPRSCRSFGLVKQKFLLESGRKSVVLHQTIINNPNIIVRNVADLRFEVHRIWNDIPRAPTCHLIHNCRRRIRNLLAARGVFIGYWRFILQLKKDLCIEYCHEVAWSETRVFIIPLIQI